MSSQLTTNDAAAIVSTLDQLTNAIRLMATQKNNQVDPLAPTPFTPAGGLTQAEANLQPLPFTQEEVDAVVEDVKRVAETHNRMAQMSERGAYVLEKVVGLVPMFFGLPTP